MSKCKERLKEYEMWIGQFTNKCYKENSYTFHPYGTMVVKPNKKEVICLYPIMLGDKVNSFIVNTFKVKYFIDENTWYRECSNHNYAENCTRHRWYSPIKAYLIYSKYSKKG